MSVARSWGPNQILRKGGDPFYNNTVTNKKTFTKSLTFPPDYETIDYQIQRR